jgi:transcriptional regulator with XRE-family HTH domain
MSIHEKIRLVRQTKGLTQEEVAHALEMSVNGYGDIERGDSDLKMSKLDKIANYFGLSFEELASVNEKIVFNQNVKNNKNIQNYCTIDKNNSMEYLEIKHELEKQQIRNDDKDKEIALLKRIIELMEAKNEATPL